MDTTFIFRFRIVLLRQDGLGSRTVPLRGAARLRLPLLVTLVATLRQSLLLDGLDFLAVLLWPRPQ